MRYLFGFLCVCALAIAPLVGCSQSDGVCSGTVCPCTEEGILAAIATGGGPYTFDCDGPQTVVTEETIVIDNDVILDGEGNLTIDAHHRDGRALSVPKGVKAELHRLATSGWYAGLANEGTLTIQDCVVLGHQIEQLWEGGAGIRNAGEMTIINSTVSGNYAGHGSGGGIYNADSATLMLVDSTVSYNGADGDGGGLYGGGILNDGDMAIINSTVSGNDAYDAVGTGGLGGGIANAGSMSVTNSTVWGNTADSGDAIAAGPSSYTEIANSLIGGDCDSSGDGSELTRVSNGYNIESPGDTCGFDPDGTDQVDVTEGELNLGELAANGGPTMTHKLGDGGLGEGSVAIDAIPGDACDVTEDQRGFPRDSMCDVGAFEVQP